MKRFYIKVNNGDNDVTVKYEFVHKDWQTLSEDEQSKQWDIAVKALDHLYKTCGRFATQVGVSKFFEQYGFERTIS